MDLNQTSDQMEMFGFTAEGAQQEADKFVDKDAAPAKDITFKDAAKFVAELTPVIGDAMAAKEVYDELQKDDPNYFLAGALGGAAIIGLIPGIGDAAAAAIRAGARKTLDVGKRIEIDPNTLGMFGGNLRAKGYDEPSEETLELMRKKFPAMEARDEVYRIGEKKDPKSFSGAIDVKVGPEKELVEVPTYPSEPERFSVRYNPDRAKVVLKKDIVTLNTGEVVDMSRNRIVPTKGSLKIEDLVEPDDNVLYRGMSAEEYRGALDQGYIKSKGDYNIGTDQQGLTFYSTNPSQAENYANNFTPGGFRATPDRPAYVVAIKKPEKIDYVTGQTEFGIKKEVPTSDIVEVFEGQPYMYQGDVRIVDDFGRSKVSGSSPDVAQVTWEKIGKPSDSKKLDEEMISVFPKPERMFPEESRPKGGDYLNPATGEVLSGRNVSSAKLSISPEGRPSFKVSNDNVEEVGSVGKGKTQIKTNLFKKKAGWKWTKAPEGMEDIATLISVENKGKHFYTIETDFSKGVNLKKYPNSKTEPRLRPTVVGEIEIGPQIGTISVRGKEHPVYQNIRTFNKGGAVMEDQMEMAFMQEGGIADDGMDVDPVSGNEVPPGSLAEEVRDDIPAQLSEGEYVVPADVVRYYGVKFFEDLRDQAKMGLAEMEANGRIGGEPVPAGGPINDQELSPQEMQAIQEMMGMAEGGEVQNPYLQQQQLYSQPRPAPIDEKRNTTITNVNPVENQMPMQSMASGGQVQGYQDSGDVMKDAPSFVQNQFNPAQYGLGFSFMGQPQQTGTTETTTTQAPQGQTFTVLYHPDYATNGRSKTFYLPRDNEIYQKYLGMGYTKQMPMTGPAGQGETTPTTTDTPITTDLTGAKVTTGGRRGPKGSTPTPEKVDYSTYDGEQLLEAFDKNRKTRIALTALGAVNPMLALFGQGATRAQEKEIIAAMDKLGIKPPENEATVLDNITDFVSGLFGKDKKEVKNTIVQQSKPEPEPVSTPTGTGISLTPPTDPKRKSLDVRKAEAQTRIDAKKRRDKRKKSVTKAKDITRDRFGRSRVTGKGAKAVSATQKAGPFNEGGLMNKKGDK